MEREDLEKLLKSVSSGKTSVEEALTKITDAPIVDLGYAKPDMQRGVRQGVSEVIYGEGKTAEQIAGIISAMRSHGQNRVLITRLDSDKKDDVCKLLSKKDADDFEYWDAPRVGLVGGKPKPERDSHITVACAGTSDYPVAEEAALTAEVLGSNVDRLYDVGVAGIHRLLSRVDEINSASCIVCVAGMEGALASVIGGLASCPVIAVPTSVGYGASFGGVAALLSMLNSCASGVSVVNIDNGFGAGYQAALIDRGPQKSGEKDSEKDPQ